MRQRGGKDKNSVSEATVDQEKDKLSVNETVNNEDDDDDDDDDSGKGLPRIAKLIIGAGGIYAAFIYYGTLQEKVFKHVGSNGEKFHSAWFLQVLGQIQHLLLSL